MAAFASQHHRTEAEQQERGGLGNYLGTDVVVSKNENGCLSFFADDAESRQQNMPT